MSEQSPTDEWLDSLLIESVNPQPWRQMSTWLGLGFLGGFGITGAVLAWPTTLSAWVSVLLLFIGGPAWLWYVFFYDWAQFECDWRLRDPETGAVVGI
jgi:hypothetical protein